MKFEEKMNVDEAIRYLTRADITVGREIKTKTAVAIEMAIKALEELQAHRKAWEKAKRTVKAYLMLEKFGSEYQDDIEKLIEECRPKEGENE